MHKSQEKAEPATPFDLMYAQHGNPITFLKAFRDMRRSKHWSTILFDHEALEWIARVWGEAAITAAGDSRLRDACLHEQQRYGKLCRDLQEGMTDRFDWGCVCLDSPSDWPHQRVIAGAIKCLEHAEVRRIQ